MEKSISLLYGEFNKIIYIVILFAIFIFTFLVSFLLSISPQIEFEEQDRKEVPLDQDDLPVTGSKVYRVFVSSEKYSGNLGGINGADRKCQSLAQDAGLDGFWQAWLSSSDVNAKDRFLITDYKRFNDNLSILDIQGNTISWDNLENEIIYDENSQLVDSWYQIWTGTESSGNKSSDRCNNWLSSSSFEYGTYGLATAKDEDWTEAGRDDCSITKHLFCFELALDLDDDTVTDDLDCDDNNSARYPGNSEICDGYDNDCDGLIPLEEFDTDNDGYMICEGDCNDNNDKVYPNAEEICDIIDNNCNGEVDEGLTTECGSNVGQCTTGVKECRYGRWTKCSGIKPEAEVCDNVDNDCDGVIDEGCSCVDGESQNCGTSLGECVMGTQYCNNSEWSSCQGGRSAQLEICDGLDNDCDGVVDENLVRECGKSLGVCEFGEQTCDDGIWGKCIGGVGDSEEICDEKDNDCDGTIDEGCNCETGRERTCGLELGECELGIQRCKDGLWGICEESVGPDKEICDKKDNDCDGEIDEGLDCEFQEKDNDETQDNEETENIAENSGSFDLQASIFIALAATISFIISTIAFLKYKTKNGDILTSEQKYNPSLNVIKESPLG